MIGSSLHQGRREIRRAFSLLELLMALTVLAVAAAMVLPAFQDDHRLRVVAAATLLTSDLEYAQLINVTHPDTPVIVRFDSETSRYWLAYEWTPETPITRDPSGEPYLVELGVGRARSSWGVTLTTARTELAFDAQGGLAMLQTAPEIVLEQGGSRIVLRISPTTGAITQSND